MNENHVRRAFTAGMMLLMLSVFPVCDSKAVDQPVQTANAAPQGNAASDDAAVADDHDPWEPLNRGLFKVHSVIDGVLLKPIAHIYRGLLPVQAQNGVRNVLTNLSAPVVLLNSVLQWDMNNAGRTVERFAVNSTVGIVGIFDVASDWGIPKEHSKDFGQTMGVYGIGTGPYLVIPLIGPSDARDALGLIADVFSDPFTYILTTNEAIALDVTRGLVKRADLLPLTDRIDRDSLDPYATYRSIFLQHRAKVVNNYLGTDVRWENDQKTGK